MGECLLQVQVEAGEDATVPAFAGRAPQSTSGTSLGLSFHSGLRF